MQVVRRGVAPRLEIQVAPLGQWRSALVVQSLLDRRMPPVKPSLPWPSPADRAAPPIWPRPQKVPTPVLQMVGNRLPQVAGQAPDQVGAGLMARLVAPNQVQAGPKAAPKRQSPESLPETFI